MALPDPSGTTQAEDTLPIADAFLEQSYLTYIVPFATNFSPEEAFRDVGNSIEGAISSIEQRDQLFFGTRFARCSCSTCCPLLMREPQTKPSTCT